MSKGNKAIPTGYGNNVATSKVPRIPRQFNTGGNDTPLWQVRTIEMDGPFGWSSMPRSHFLDAVFPKMKNFESMKWSEILGRNSHEVRVADISKDAQKRLEHLNLEDVDKLVSLRLEGQERIWGIRMQQVFRILWWDPNHQVCPSHKRHT